MKPNELKTITVSGRDRQTALASPLRLEILGLFTSGEPLAIADMAQLMGRTAVSLYYHVGLLEKAGLLRCTGTRPKGKRFETLYFPAAARFELETEEDDGSIALAQKAMANAFRMAERDLAEALRSDDGVTEGPGRNTLAYRLHLRASPKLLAGINEHLDAIEELLKADAARNPEPSPDDQHLSLTLAFLPLKGRGKGHRPQGE